MQIHVHSHTLDVHTRVQCKCMPLHRELLAELTARGLLVSTVIICVPYATQENLVRTTAIKIQLKMKQRGLTVNDLQRRQQNSRSRPPSKVEELTFRTVVCAEHTHTLTIWEQTLIGRLLFASSSIRKLAFCPDFTMNVKMTLCYRNRNTYTEYVDLQYSCSTRPQNPASVNTVCDVTTVCQL